MGWIRIKENTTGASIIINTENIDYLREIDSKNIRIITNSGNSFEVDNDQLKSIFEEL